MLLTAAAYPCRAQYPDERQTYFVDVSGGWTGVRKADSKNFGSFPVIQAGAGKLLTTSDPEKPGLYPDYRHWNIFLTGQFLWGESDLKQAALPVLINSNPQTPSLLSAQSGKGRFYSTTAGPRFQYSRDRWDIYGQVAGGWLRRSLELTGASTQGGALQPSSPSVFSRSANSGDIRATAGVAYGVKKLHVFAEIGMLAGFAVNHETMLAPILSGGVRW